MQLRKVKFDDAEQLLEWKNDKETRLNALVTQEKIKMENHLKWLEKRLKKGGFYIITNGKIDYGDLRFEENEITIRISPKYRNMGIGKWAIKKAQKMFPYLWAKIVIRNINSLNLFIHCGFKITEFKKTHYILKWKSRQ